MKNIEKILTEMRKITFGEECCPDRGADFQRSNRWKEYADRIEAAVRDVLEENRRFRREARKREKERTKTMIESLNIGDKDEDVVRYVAKILTDAGLRGDGLKKPENENDVVICDELDAEDVLDEIESRHGVNFRNSDCDRLYALVSDGEVSVGQIVDWLKSCEKGY